MKLKINTALAVALLVALSGTSTHGFSDNGIPSRAIYCKGTSHAIDLIRSEGVRGGLTDNERGNGRGDGARGSKYASGSSGTRGRCEGSKDPVGI